MTTGGIDYSFVKKGDQCDAKPDERYTVHLPDAWSQAMELVPGEMK